MRSTAAFLFDRRFTHWALMSPATTGKDVGHAHRRVRRSGARAQRITRHGRFFDVRFGEARGGRHSCTTTHKSFGPDPVSRATLDELLELARWAPNHHRTNPWRFRVIGPETLEQRKEAAGPQKPRSSTRADARRGLGGLERRPRAGRGRHLRDAAAIYASLLAAQRAWARAIGDAGPFCAPEPDASRSDCPTASASWA
jgi:hypothetical protein